MDTTTKTEAPHCDACMNGIDGVGEPCSTCAPKAQPAETLHVFFDDYEWWVARDVADAMAQQREATGLTVDDQLPAEDWNELPDEKPLTMYEDEEKTEEQARTMTCAEWGREHGRGLLGGTEG